MLRVSIDRIELALDAIKDQLNILIINFLFFTKVNASDPLVLDFLKGRFDFHDDSQFIKHVPQDLKLSIKVLIFGSLGNVGKRFEFSVDLLDFPVLLAFFEGVVLLLH
jgi:hypothetical protein